MHLKSLLLYFGILQNADMVFERCFVPDSARLPRVNSFKDTKIFYILKNLITFQKTLKVIIGFIMLILQMLKYRRITA